MSELGSFLRGVDLKKKVEITPCFAQKNYFFLIKILSIDDNKSD